MLSNKEQSFVSVIVPVYNGELSIEKTIQALLDQDYPQDCYEIIVVDNGSIDKTFEIIKKYPVTVLEEREIKTSYAARNRGVSHARGEILAFTDADAIPRSDWISAAVDLFTAQGPDMIGGAIEFSFSKNPSAAEYLDSLIHLDNEAASYKGTAKTANLFVRKSVFDAIGLFRTDVASGEDVGWTSRATQAGFVLIYGPNVFVDHPAREFFELVEKHVRVGSGSINIWKSQGKSSLWIIVRWMSLWTPLLPLRVMITLLQRHKHIMDYPIISMSLIAWICTIGTAIGILKKMISKQRPLLSEKSSSAGGRRGGFRAPDPLVLENGMTYQALKSWSQFFGFLNIIAINRRWNFFGYVLYAKLIASHRSAILVLQEKENRRVIGGSVFSDMPLNFWYFDTNSRLVMKQLVSEGYCYAGSFFIIPELRNQGMGTEILNARTKNSRTKYYFAPSPRTRDFYLRAGARPLYHGRHTLFIMEKESNNDPLVSIIMPVYNRAQHIDRAIESVLRQTYQNWELIIIDDGSSDNFQEVLKKYHDSRIRILSLSENHGVSYSRNRGIELSRGEYLAFLDSDDMYHQDKLLLQVRTLQCAAPSVGIVYCGIIIHDQYGNVRTKYARAQGNIAEDSRKINVLGTPLRVMMRRACIESRGMFDESLHVFEDRDLWVRITQKYSVIALSYPLVTYYESLDAASGNSKKILAAYQKFIEKYKLDGALPIDRSWMTLKMYHQIWYRNVYWYHTIIFYVLKYFQ